MRMKVSWSESAFTGPHRVWQVAAAALLVAVVVASLSALQLYISWQARGYDAAFTELLSTELVEWSMWAAVTPVVLALDGRMGFERFGVKARAFLVHILFALLFLALHNLVMVAIAPDAGADFATYYWQRFAIKLPGGVLVYGLILGAFWVLRLLAAYHRRSLEGARLEAQLADARFASLSSRLHPHFLFNALHSIGHLVREGERRRAVDALAELGDLLRRSLDRAGEAESTLGDELEFLRRYLHIQHLRFGDRLEVREEVAQEAKQALVPTLLLQPLVENAIRHGLELDREPGLVLVGARRDDSRLEITIADNGKGFDAGTQGGEGARNAEGVGLGATRNRLSLLYGDEASLTVSANPPFNTEITIRLPYHTAPSVD